MAELCGWSQWELEGADKWMTFDQTEMKQSRRMEGWVGQGLVPIFFPPFI